MRSSAPAPLRSAPFSRDTGGMHNEALRIGLYLGSAWLAGSLIGLERTFHGRPAGFRTHALVCLASALLMLVTTHQWEWLGTVPLETIRTDPTRMAAGIMTGIGFLGAGVIFKERLTVRGLTTAASIWLTSALGILFGIGFFYPAVLGTLAALGTLAVFRWMEDRLPSQSYAHCSVRFLRDEIVREEELRAWIAKHGLFVTNLNYHLTAQGRMFEYQMVLRGTRRDAFRALAEDLQSRPLVLEFSVAPTGD